MIIKWKFALPHRWRFPQSWGAWLETLAVILLTTASLATAWNGYQASQWSSVQSSASSHASTLRIQANEAATLAQVDLMMDMLTFNGYADAFVANNTLLIEYFSRQFSDRLAPAVETWRATDPIHNEAAPASPFVMPEYVIPAQQRADQLAAQADDLVAEASQASERSGEYIRNSLLFAMVLFFAGIAGKIRRLASRTAIEVVGAALFVYALYHIFSLPMK